MENLKNELKVNKNGQIYDEGYRIVYFYENNEYYVGEYCKTIEGFMIGFADNSPLMDDEDIPEFISVDDLLDRYLEDVNDISAVGLYKITGECIQKKQKTNRKGIKTQKNKWL